MPDDENKKFPHIKKMTGFYARAPETDQVKDSVLFLRLNKVLYLLILFSYFLFKVADFFIQAGDRPIEFIYIILQTGNLFIQFGFFCFETFYYRIINRFGIEPGG